MLSTTSFHASAISQFMLSVPAHLKSAFSLPMVLLLCALVNLSACATAPTDPIEKAEYERINDPLEPTNRAIFSFNSVVQAVIIRPLARLFNTLPNGVQTAFDNFFTNLSEPRNVVNALLQGDPDTAGTSFGRFMTNSTVGLAGLVNVTGSENHAPRDFGQTLDQWTGDNSAYLELPFFGASSVTAGLGLLVDGLYSIPRIQTNRGGNPILPIAAGVSKGAILYGQNIDSIDPIHNTSPDPYASFRSIYQQRRQSFVFGVTDDSLDELELD